jgi:hypothetical protein
MNSLIVYALTGAMYTKFKNKKLRWGFYLLSKYSTIHV